MRRKSASLLHKMSQFVSRGNSILVLGMNIQGSWYFALTSQSRPSSSMALRNTGSISEGSCISSGVNLHMSNSLPRSPSTSGASLVLSDIRWKVIIGELGARVVVVDLKLGIDLPPLCAATSRPPFSPPVGRGECEATDPVLSTGQAHRS